MKKIRYIEAKRRYQGYDLTLLKREKDIALYQMAGEHHYEVVRITLEPLVEGDTYTQNLRDQGYTHREVYPHREKWGIRGYTYTKLEDAQNRMRGLLNAETY